MSDLYLILHKVRGLPAFDIAERCDNMGTAEDPGPWWIIPTSGHRAHPFMEWALEDLMDVSDINKNGTHDRPWAFDHHLPTDWPDHYQTISEPKAKGILDAVIKKLTKPIGSIRRI